MATPKTNEALSLVSQAVQKDSQNDYAGAIQLYKQAVHVMQFAVIEHANNPQTKNMLVQKQKEYQSRIEQLEKLAPQKQPDSANNDILARMAKLGHPTLHGQGPPTTGPSMSSSSSGMAQSGPSNPSPDFSNSSGFKNENDPYRIATQPLGPMIVPQVSFEDHHIEEHIIEEQHHMSRLPATQMDKGEAWNTANQIAEEGKRLDDQRQFEKALNQYKESIPYFFRAVSQEMDPNLKNNLSARFNAFFNRATQLASHLKQPAPVMPTNSNPVPSQVMSSAGPNLETSAPQKPFADTTQVVTEVRYDTSQTLKGLVTGKQDPTSFTTGTHCSFCKAKFSPTEVYKTLNSECYHEQCLFQVTGLEKEDVKEFLLVNGHLRLKTKLERKTFKRGDDIHIKIELENTAGRKVNFIHATILCIETNVFIDKNLQSNIKRKETKAAHVDFRECFPMEQGTVKLNERIAIPTKIPPSERAGTAFTREYELDIKVDLPFYNSIASDCKIVYPITILE